MSVVVNRRTFCLEVSSREGVEREVMRILAGVRTDSAENCRISQEQGFLGNINYPRVSRRLSCTLIEYNDGQQINISVLYLIVLEYNSTSG